MHTRATILSLTLAALTFVPVQAAKITVEKSDRGAVVKADGQLFTEYVVRSNTKPILWPLIGPDGKRMTRDYPMLENQPGERYDHPHHRSMWFTHGEVNDIDFWADKPAEKKGKVVHREFVALESGERGKIVTRNDWMSPDLKKKICEDQRTFIFYADPDKRWIDVELVVKATNGPVTFGDTKEGCFGVRVAGTMKVDAKPGGEIVTSRGKTNAAAWGKQAEWVDYHGPVDGETVGVAIMNHPSSFRYPTYWHVRTYGLFTANPFGLHHFTGAKEGAGAHTIESGETMTLRYRVLLHKGDEKAGRVAEIFDAYRKSAP
jgi:ketosteroid isomerase-like protein